MAKLNNSKDLIYRGDVYDALMQRAKPLVGGGIATFVVDYPNAVDSVPAVPQPMSAVEFIDAMVAIRNRVRYCKDCPLDKRMRNCFICECIPDIVLSPDELVSDVQKWAREHPERST